MSHPEKADVKRGSVYEVITERIVAMLATGTVPWQKPWKVSTGLPRNLVSGKPYRGMNILLLHAMSYESPLWLTFRQAKELGGSIKKGEKACPVIFGKRQETEDEITGEKSHYTVLRLYSVFNIAQCEGLKNIPAPAAAPVTVNTTAEESRGRLRRVRRRLCLLQRLLFQAATAGLMLETVEAGFNPRLFAMK